MSNKNDVVTAQIKTHKLSILKYIFQFKRSILAYIQLRLLVRKKKMYSLKQEFDL